MKNKNSKAPINLLQNEKLVTNPNDIANIFNDFFVEIGPSIARNISKSITFSILFKELFNKLYVFTPYDENEIEKTIQSLNNKKP